MPNLTSLKPLLFIVVFYLLTFWLSLSYWAFRDARGGLINPHLDDIAYQGFARRLVDDERAGTLR